MVVRTTGSVDHCYDHQERQITNSHGSHSWIFQLTSQITVQRHNDTLHITSLDNSAPKYDHCQVVSCFEI